ncbi:MAG: hypothetical protein QW035_01775 [Candidatus Anstonellales archaeon]
MAKKGLLHYLILLLKYIYGLVKWVAITLWGLLKWLFFGLVLALKWVSSLLSAGARKIGHAYEHSKRPKGEAKLEPFVEIKRANGSLPDFEEKLYSGKSMIGLVLGSRGSGKSAIGMRIAENIRATSKLPLYTVGFAKNSLPSWITPVEKFSEVKNNSFLLVDEGGIQFSSRNSMSELNKLLSELLLISRHKDISVLFITQNSANIDINTLRQVDYLILKSPSLLQLDFERKKIKEIYEEAKEGFEEYKQEKGLAYIYSNYYKGFIANALPSFWSVNLSKSYRGKT